MNRYDIGIIGGGPGGLTCAIEAKRRGMSYVVIEKGSRILQGIIDSYPRGKKVYPTVPKGETDPFPVKALMPDPGKLPVEEYIAAIEDYVSRQEIDVQLNEDFLCLEKEEGGFLVVTRQNRYRVKSVVLAFGSNVPIDLGVYGEAKTIARNLDNPQDHIGAPTLVLGGGNAAADVVATLSRAKRAAGDQTAIYWGNRKVQFKVNKETARDLGEEILVGGQIRILQGAIPQIGEVDDDGIDRLVIMTQQLDAGDGVLVKQAMSFQMKHVIACIGTQGPAPLFEKLGLQQITCTAGVCRIAREGTQLIILNPDFQSSIEGVYVIGGAISPAYIQIREEGAFNELKHTNLIYTAMKDGVVAVAAIAGQLSAS